MSDDPSILSRWSARKRAVAAEEAQQTAAQAAGATDAEARAAELDANRRAAQSVDLDALDKDSDLSVFLRDGVPDLLRKAALQKVWRSSPVFANLDELVDYGEDFGRKDLIMESFTSAWQAGRGYLKEIEDAADASPDAPDQRAAAEPKASPPSGGGDAETVEAAQCAEEPSEPDAAETAPPAPPADAPPQHTPAQAPPEPVRSARGSLRARLARDTDEV